MRPAADQKCARWAMRGLKNDGLASCPRLLASPMGAGPAHTRQRVRRANLADGRACDLCHHGLDEDAAILLMEQKLLQNMHAM